MTQVILDYEEKLQALMAQANIKNLQELSQLSGVSQRQLLRLQYGLFPKMSLEIVLKIAQTLQISLTELIETFTIPKTNSLPTKQETESPDFLRLHKEYQKLEKQLTNQKEELRQKFQQETLKQLESWLLQWPNAANAAQKNPQLSAQKLLPLVKPIEKLLQKWDVETIGKVGEKVKYNPQWHQLISGNAQADDLVEIRYVGYKQGEKLLYRAQVNTLGSN